ncbi:hypothetical protein [Candidatus Protochlamydia amoebophila]|uniref:Uncharacterized protein n=1 Tax=Protochlamydia amoebophila (strain UWE25) TaxID=264201 RepID=Q6MCQ1_PARUW|nr:hypothetical protein [Candidatus Protochlamydia amoebophila]CAF23648.1 unnamed protein product [Candidatus Protochlamydia amoebophila UWE25]
MYQKIDYAVIKNGILSGVAYAAHAAHQTKEIFGNLAGHAVRVIKSGANYAQREVNRAQPYLKNPYIAATSVATVSIINLIIADAIVAIVRKILPSETKTQKSVNEVVSSLTGVVTWLGGMWAYRYYAQIPLSLPIYAVSTIAGSLILGISNSQKFF